MEKESPKYIKLLAPLNIGLNIMAGMIVFTLIGYAIDLRLESFYIATLLGIGVGLFYCFYEIWKLTKIEQ